MNRQTQHFLQTVQMHLRELEIVTACEDDLMQRPARAERGLAAARRAMAAIETFVRAGATVPESQQP